MRGHVYKRGRTGPSCTTSSPRDGKRRQRTKGGFATRKRRAAVPDRHARADRQRLLRAPSKLTVAEYLEREWLPAVEGTLRPLSVKRYRSVIRLYINPRIGSQRLQSLSGGHLNGLYAELEQAGLSSSTRRLVHAVIRRALRDAVRWGRVPRNAPAWPTRRHAARSRAQVVDRRRAAPVPRACRRRSAVRALAARGHYRDAPRRARGADVARARP